MLFGKQNLNLIHPSVNSKIMILMISAGFTHITKRFSNYW